MSRTDLTEVEISQMKRRAQGVLKDVGTPWEVSKPQADQILRLTGELLELRNRESNVRQLHDLEWDEY